MAKQIKTAVKAGEEYEFLDVKGKHLFTVWINPSDLGMIQRAQDLADFLNDLDLSIKDSEGNTKKEPTLEETAKILKENTEVLAEKLDGLFNADISAAIFSVMSPFTPPASLVLSEWELSRTSQQRITSRQLQSVCLTDYQQLV